MTCETQVIKVNTPARQEQECLEAELNRLATLVANFQLQVSQVTEQWMNISDTMSTVSTCNDVTATK